MRDTAGQLSDRLHLLRLAELRFRLLTRGHFGLRGRGGETCFVARLFDDPETLASVKDDAHGKAQNHHHRSKHRGGEHPDRILRGAGTPLKQPILDRDHHVDLIGQLARGATTAKLVCFTCHFERPTLRDTLDNILSQINPAGDDFLQIG